MPSRLIRSDDYVEYCRETAKRARDLHDLALRGRHLKHVTRHVHAAIIEALALHPLDDLVDIGCGDGTLLHMAKQIAVHSAVGFLATDEEVALVRKTGLDVRQALSDHIPLAAHSASAVVCNNVLLIVPRQRIPATLQEISRIARPGARIFLGEIPSVELRDPTPRFETRRELLRYLYVNDGPRAWLGMVRRMAWWQLTGQDAVLRPGTAQTFFASPEEFTAMAAEAGLRLVRYWRHEPIPTRNNYLFHKPA